MSKYTSIPGTVEEERFFLLPFRNLDNIDADCPKGQWLRLQAISLAPDKAIMLESVCAVGRESEGWEYFGMTSNRSSFLARLSLRRSIPRWEQFRNAQIVAQDPVSAHDKTVDINRHVAGLIVADLRRILRDDSVTRPHLEMYISELEDALAAHPEDAEDDFAYPLEIGEEVEE